MQNIVEIADYDPLKNIALAIGKEHPSLETPVHWMIHHAREDVHAILIISSQKLYEKYVEVLPKTSNERKGVTLEWVKEVLKTLKQGKKILLQNHKLMIVGLSLKEVETILVEMVKGYEG